LLTSFLFVESLREVFQPKLKDPSRTANCERNLFLVPSIVYAVVGRLVSQSILFMLEVRLVRPNLIFALASPIVRITSPIGGFYLAKTPRRLREPFTTWR
jgi:hypothetical protein